MFIGRARTIVGKIIKQWAPRWANVGLDLSILDITDDYLEKEVPDKNVDLGKPRLVFLVDGKDYLCAPKRSDTTIEKAQFSSKNEKTAARDLTLSTPAGLVFEESPLFCGRAGERQIIEWMGSLGPTTAPIHEWKDVAINDPWTKGDDIFWTALSDAMSAKEVEEALQEDTSGLLPDGLLDDGIPITGQPTGLSKEGLGDVTNASDEESDDDTAAVCLNKDKDESARNIFGISDALSGYLTIVKHNIVDKSQRDIGANKRPPILTQEILKMQNDRALINDPNQSGKRKLCQLERHQRLHILYELGELEKCLLSYFLLETEPDRLKLLRWMGSNLAENIVMPDLKDIKEIALRLVKIPERYGVGADKGFTGIEKFLPNCNDADTPPGVVNSKKERLSKDQIEAEIPITTVRGGSETVFKRIVNEDALREKIPYYLIQWLPHVHALAHGEANLCKPFRYPGRNSSVGADYWDNKIDYARTSRTTTQSYYIGTSRKRMCSKCKTGGIVEICSSCKKWYHGRCHDFESCNGIVNPYI